MNTLADCGEMGQGVGLDIGDTFFMGSVGKIYTANPRKTNGIIGAAKTAWK